MSVRRVAFAGDWHGNFPWAMACLRTAAQNGLDTIYQVGDFGIWPGDEGAYYLRQLSKRCGELGLELRVVPGNHEDYNQLDKMSIENSGWLVPLDLPHLFFAPRGHTWLDHGVRFAALGGAASIDVAWRTENISWWPQEAITGGNVRTLAANVANQGWDRVDVFLTHEAPAGLHRPGQPAPWLTEEIKHNAWTQRVLLREATDTVAPRWLLHGHWHAPFRDTIDGVRLDGSDYHCEVLGLDMDDTSQNLYAADLVPGSGLTNLTPLTIETKTGTHKVR